MSNTNLPSIHDALLAIEMRTYRPLAAGIDDFVAYVEADGLTGHAPAVLEFLRAHPEYLNMGYATPRRWLSLIGHRPGLHNHPDVAASQAKHYVGEDAADALGEFMWSAKPNDSSGLPTVRPDGSVNWTGDR